MSEEELIEKIRELEDRIYTLENQNIKQAPPLPTLTPNSDLNDVKIVLNTILRILNESSI